MQRVAAIFQRSNVVVKATRAQFLFGRYTQVATLHAGSGITRVRLSNNFYNLYHVISYEPSVRISASTNKRKGKSTDTATSKASYSTSTGAKAGSDSVAAQLQQKLLGAVMRNLQIRLLMRELFEVLTKNKIIDPAKPTQAPSMFAMLKIARDKEILGIAAQLNQELVKEGVVLQSADLMGLFSSFEALKNALKSK